MRIQIIIASILFLIISGTSGDSQNKYMEHEIENPIKKDYTIINIEKNQTVAYYQKKIDSLDKVIPALKHKINIAIEMKRETVKAKRSSETLERKWIFFKIKPEIKKIEISDSSLADSVFIPPMPQPLKKESFIERLFHHKKRSNVKN